MSFGLALMVLCVKSVSALFGGSMNCGLTPSFVCLTIGLGRTDTLTVWLRVAYGFLVMAEATSAPVIVLRLFALRQTFNFTSYHIDYRKTSPPVSGFVSLNWGDVTRCLRHQIRSSGPGVLLGQVPTGVEGSDTPILTPAKGGWRRPRHELDKGLGASLFIANLMLVVLNVPAIGVRVKLLTILRLWSLGRSC